MVDGTEKNEFIEHYELQPIDRQTNGPQLFYGLRYHTHIVKPGEVETFHDQIGYWLWEPATKTVTFTLAIPRGQVLLAAGPAEPGRDDVRGHGRGRFRDVRHLVEPVPRRGVPHAELPHGRDHQPRRDVVIRGGSASRPPRSGRALPHTDRNTLTRIGDPTPNPLAASRRSATRAGPTVAAGPVTRAEGVGFEPTVTCATMVFETIRFGRSRIPPGEIVRERQRSRPNGRRSASDP